MFAARLTNMIFVTAIALAAAACGPATSLDAGQAVDVEIQPPSVALAPRGTQSFAAAVTGAGNTSVTWTVSETGGGKVDPTGLYTAPTATGTYHLVATSQADPSVSATAVITITSTPPAASVAVSPSSAAVTAGGTVPFTATVSGSADQTVTWSVVEAAGGTISATGLYKAPATAGTYHVKAVPAANPSASATASVVVSTSGGGTTARFVSGYWADWNDTNMVKYAYTQIDWSALTHLVVARSAVTSGASLAYDGGNLTSTLAKQVTAAAHANGRKAILMMGGVGSNTGFAAATGDTYDSALVFATNIKTFAQRDGFDGVDIDWESVRPAQSSGAVADMVRIKNLALALRAVWPDIVLTEAIGWQEAMTFDFSIMKDGQGNWLMDQFNVMTYDAANSWGAWQVWFHNALDDAGPNRPSTVAASLGALAASGVPKARIGMGLPFYGSAWTRRTSASRADWSAYYPRESIPTAWQDGAGASQGQDKFWTYKYILDNYVKPYDGPTPVVDAAGRTQADGTHVGSIFDAAAGAPYITGGSAGWTGLKGTGPAVTFLSYEDPTSIAAKGNWIKANGYGGTIIWLINEGATDTNGTNPLLSAVKAAFLQ